MWHSFLFFIRDPHCWSRWIPKNAAQPHNNPMWSPRPGAAHTHTPSQISKESNTNSSDTNMTNRESKWKKRTLNYCRSKTNFKHECSEVLPKCLIQDKWIFNQFSCHMFGRTQDASHFTVKSFPGIHKLVLNEKFKKDMSRQPPLELSGYF